MSRVNFTEASPQGGLGSSTEVIWKQEEIRYLRLKELRRVWLCSEGIKALKTKHG